LQAEVVARPPKTRDAKTNADYDAVAEAEAILASEALVTA